MHSGAARFYEPVAGGPTEEEWNRTSDNLMERKLNRQTAMLVPRCDELDFPEQYKVDPLYIILNVAIAAVAA